MGISEASNFFHPADLFCSSDCRGLLWRKVTYGEGSLHLSMVGVGVNDLLVILGIRRDFGSVSPKLFYEFSFI